MNEIKLNFCGHCQDSALAQVLKERDEWRLLYGKARKLINIAWTVPGVVDKLIQPENKDDLHEVLNELYLE